METVLDASLRILAIAPYEAMKEALQLTAAAFPTLRLDAYTGDLQEGVDIVRQVDTENYDAILSRGGTAELIRPVTDLPVIEIPVSVYDVLRTIKLSENYNDRCAIVGFPGVTENAHILCDLLRINIPIQTVKDSESAKQTLEQLSSQGIHTVICDMVTHRIARSKGLNALLITSGVSSLHQALQDAMEQGTTFRRIRNENLILRGIISKDSRQSVVFDENQEVVFSFGPNITQETIALMRKKIPSLRNEDDMLSFHQAGSTLHTITATSFHARGKQFAIFRDQPGHISLRSSRPGIRAYDQAECEHLFMGSFFSISGSLGELEQRLTSLATSLQPMMIVGEEGTGKEQIARALYLRSPYKNHSLVTVDAELLNEKTWDFLLESQSSPLTAYRTTIFFRHLEKAPAHRQQTLLSLIEDTGLERRLWLLFSCDAKEHMPLHDFFQKLSLRQSSMTLHLPTLRSRRDEIPALASLYLGNLNVELNKQVAGFDPGALEMLIQYDWPGNYTQFKHVLHELATVTDGLYISNVDVADLLARERRQYRLPLDFNESPSFTGLTLAEMNQRIVHQALIQNNGNQSLTARQLGISRTTLWRMLGQAEGFPKKEE